MLKRALKVVFYCILFGSLLVFDYLLGNGFMGMIQRNYCKIYCFVKKTLKDQANTPQVPEPNDYNDVLTLIMEVFALVCTMLILNGYRKYTMGCMNDMGKLIEGKNDTNELLEKLSFCRMNRSIDLGPSFAFDKPQLIKPLDVEVPVLHMAIIDTLGTTRSQPERGDAGDSYNITDSAILSVATVLDKDFKLPETLSQDTRELDGGNTIQFSNNRYLWDVIEEE